MTTLFIDSTHFLGVGLYCKDRNLAVIEYYQIDKQSTYIHAKIDEVLKKNDLEIKDIKNLVTISGPGSYTGMRVSEGISQVFEWQGFETYSIHQYEVPRLLLGEEDYVWISKAFKGEDFIYLAAEDKKVRVASDKLEDSLKVLSDKKIYTSFNSNSKTDKIYPFDIEETHKFIKDTFSEFIEKVLLNKFKRPLYYYRSIEEEFKVPKS